MKRYIYYEKIQKDSKTNANKQDKTMAEKKKQNIEMKTGISPNKFWDNFQWASTENVEGDNKQRRIIVPKRIFK